MKNIIRKVCRVLPALLCPLAMGPLQAADVVPVKLMSLEIASDIAQGAIAACRADGYQVSVVVVDRSGRTQVLLRDVFSNQYFTELAAGKARAVVLANTGSGELRDNRADMVDELNLLDGIFVLQGGLPVQVAGSTIGAVGVSGAPGGDKDEACARKGLDAVQERLDFAE